jgi:hypothetical protein
VPVLGPDPGLFEALVAALVDASPEAACRLWGAARAIHSLLAPIAGSEDLPARAVSGVTTNRKLARIRAMAVKYVSSFQACRSRVEVVVGGYDTECVQPVPCLQNARLHRLCRSQHFVGRVSRHQYPGSALVAAKP